MRSEPSIQLGGAGSGSGSGRYSSSGSNSMTFVRGCSGIPNENSAPCVIGYSKTRGEWACLGDSEGKKPQRCADLPAAGRLRPALQVLADVGGRVGTSKAAALRGSGIHKTAALQICCGGLGSLQ